MLLLVPNQYCQVPNIARFLSNNTRIKSISIRRFRGILRKFLKFVHDGKGSMLAKTQMIGNFLLCIYGDRAHTAKVEETIEPCRIMGTVYWGNVVLKRCSEMKLEL